MIIIETFNAFVDFIGVDALLRSLDQFMWIKFTSLTY